MELETPVQERAFYSRHASYTVTVKPAREVIKDGMVKQVDSKIVEFHRIGDGYGRYMTSDPEVIAALENNKLVMTQQQYNEESIPAEKRLQIERNDKTRMIEEKNRLVEELQQRDENLRQKESFAAAQAQRIKELESQLQSPSKK